MQSTLLFQEIVEFDAQESYEAHDIQELLAQVSRTRNSTVVILKNAHYLTTKAFITLYEYLQQKSNDVTFLLVSSDESKIFPPLLQWLKLNLN